MTRKRAAIVMTAALACLAGGAARAQAPAKARGGRGPTATEFDELKRRVDKQNELILELTRIESEHYGYLVKLLQTNRPGVIPTSSPNQPVPTAEPVPVPPPQPEHDESATAARAKVATIAGHVVVTGKTWGPTYVYVENIRETAIDRSV